MKAVFEKQDRFLIRGRRETGFRGWPPTFHHHGEIIYVIEGNISTTVDGKSHLLVPGEMSVIFPYVAHSYEDAPDARALVLLMSPEGVAFDTTLCTKRPIQHCVDGKPYYAMLERAVELIRRGKIKTAQGYVNAVLGEFLEQVSLEDADHSGREAAVRILNYCSEHFTENITLHTVAQALYVSQSQVSKVFAQKLKCSFREYINRLRVEKAKTLLRDRSRKVLEVMNACGFRNQSSFNRVFRELCGMSPREYRSSNR